MLGAESREKLGHNQGSAASCPVVYWLPHQPDSLPMNVARLKRGKEMRAFRDFASLCPDSYTDAT